MIKININGVILAGLLGDLDNAKGYSVDKDNKCYYNDKHFANIVSQEMSETGITCNIVFVEPIQSLVFKSITLLKDL